MEPFLVLCSLVTPKDNLDSSTSITAPSLLESLCVTSSNPTPQPVLVSRPALVTVQLLTRLNITASAGSFSLGPSCSWSSSLTTFAPDGNHRSSFSSPTCRVQNSFLSSPLSFLLLSSPSSPPSSTLKAAKCETTCEFFLGEKKMSL